jgi:hypothetical protein
VRAAAAVAAPPAWDLAGAEASVVVVEAAEVVGDAGNWIAE